MIIHYIKLTVFFALIACCPIHCADLNHTSPPTSFVQDTKDQYLQFSIGKAMHTRRISEIDRLSKERGTPEEEALAKEIAGNAPDYTCGDTHEASIRFFIESHFGPASSSLYCVAEDRIGKREFVFIDKENEIVVKVFPQIPKHYFKIIHELSGHQAFRELNLAQAGMAEFLRLGKYSLNGVDYLLLAMTFVKGEEIRKFFAPVYSAGGPAEKQEAIDDLKKIFYLLGTVMGEAHSRGKMKASPSADHTEAVMQSYTLAAGKLIDKYKEADRENSEMAERIWENFITISSQYDTGPVYFAPSHGDAHLGNFLYDKASEKITVIDSVRAHLSVDSEDLPISDSYSYDCVRIEDSIIKGILTYENDVDLIQELIGTFRQGYEISAGDIMNQSHFELNRFLRTLKQYVSTFKWKTEDDLVKRESLRRMHAYYEGMLCNAVALLAIH